IQRFGSNFQRRNAFRRFTAAGDVIGVFGLSGPHFFGFAHPQIIELIEFLPDAEMCSKYKFRFNIEANDDDNRRIANETNSNNTTSNNTAYSAAVLSTSEYGIDQFTNAEGCARAHGFNSKTKDW